MVFETQNNVRVADFVGRNCHYLGNSSARLTNDRRMDVVVAERRLYVFCSWLDGRTTSSCQVHLCLVPRGCVVRRMVHCESVSLNFLGNCGNKHKTCIENVLKWTPRPKPIQHPHRTHQVRHPHPIPQVPMTRVRPQD